MTEVARLERPTLEHGPLGNEHPYLAEPTERTPRYPLAGDDVSIGIRAAPELKAVSVRWTLNGVPQATIQATSESGSANLWRAVLPTQKDGSEINYWVEAKGANSLGPFTYRTFDWQAQPQTSVRWQSTKPGVWEGQLVNASSESVDVPLIPLLVERLNGDSAATQRIRLTFACPPDEAFYGFGERFNALDQRGQRLDVRCFEEYKNQGTHTYIPMPFFVSSRCYGLFLDTSRHVTYDLAASAQDRWSFEAETGPDGNLKLVLLTSPDLLRITGLFSEYIGKPEMLPAWAFGPWMSGNEWNTQSRVMEEIDQTRNHDIPATVLVIEAWSDETTFYIWNDAEYTPKPGGEAFKYDDFAFRPDGKWPNPKAMIERMHELGIRLVLWQVPAFKRLEAPHPQHEADQAHMIDEGYAVREADGSPYHIRPLWFKGGMVWDVTSPDARDWWLSKRAYLLDDLKIDGFKTDGGEHLWGYGLRFADGRTSDELWNEYPSQYVGAYHEFAKAHRGEALTFSRAGFTGAQRYPAHWAGDENSTWDAFRHSILAGLSAGISGIPFWGWDIGGFSGEIPTAELYMRAAGMAAFCPIMQYHAEFNEHRLPRRDRTPWNIQERTGNPDVIPTYRFYANVRMSLMPYLLAEAEHCVNTGEPMMRALSLAYPDDANCRSYPYQYLFGRDLLVAPVVEPLASSQLVYLPVGQWYDLWSGEAIQGGQALRIEAPLDKVPVFVRGGSRLPLYLPEGKRLGDFVDNAIHAEPTVIFRAEGLSMNRVSQM